MELVLDIDAFENGRYVVQYGENREALFIINDESFPGLNSIGHINNIVILTRTITSSGEATDAQLQSAVIGFGNNIVGVHSSDRYLRGKVLSKDNMDRCTIILYEE